MSFQDVFYNSIPFNLNIAFSDDVSVNAVIDELLPKIKLPPKDNNKHLLKVLLLNVFANYHTATDAWTGFPKTRNYYNTKSRYNSNKVSKKIIEIMEQLVSKKLLIFHGGFNSQNSYQKSYTSRIKASKKLADIFFKHKMDNQKLDISSDVECIIVKKKQGKNNIQIEYEDTPSYIIKRSLCSSYNNLLRRSHIDCVDIPDTGIFIGNSKYPIHVSQNNKWVKRVFIKDDETTIPLYGRWHGGFWQQMNSEWRDRIKINGLETTEIDYSGMGINILYDLAEKEIDDVDPYNLTGYYDNPKYTVEELRPLLKKVLMIMTNSKSSVQALKAIETDVNDADNNYPSDIDLKVLMNAFKKRHDPIKDFFFSNIGNVQYYFDSYITTKIIDHFTLKNIVILTVHDSYVIDLNNADELDEVMKDSYMEVIRKYKKDIKVKYENKQYAKMRFNRSYPLPEPSNPVEEMHQFNQQQWTSPDVTRMTKKDYHIEDGRGWGIKRLFKDKDYKQRLLDWRALGLHKVESYYVANKQYHPFLLMDLIYEYETNTLDKNKDNHLTYKEYIKKNPKKDYIQIHEDAKKAEEEELKQEKENNK